MNTRQPIPKGARKRSWITQCPAPQAWRGVVWIFALLAVSAAASATEYDPVFDLWPLFRYDAGPRPPYRRVEALGPIIEWRSTPAEADFYLRPLANWRDDRPSRVAESEWPWPFVFGTGRADLSRQVVFPLFLRDRETFSDGAVRNRFVLLPLFLYQGGRGPTSVMFFPLFGVFHEMFARVKVVFVLWPLYVYQREKDVSGWSVLHPIFGYKRWDDGGIGFKMWPLFGFDNRPEKQSNLFVLWPVFTKQHMRKPQGEIRRLYVFPFYGQIEEPGGHERAALWPFFRHRVETYEGRDDWWYPWPVLGRHLGEKSYGWTFWPLFAVRDLPTERQVRFLWPLGWYRNLHDDRGQASSFRFIPLFFREREERSSLAPDAPEAPAVTGAWQVWPLIKVRYGAHAGIAAEDGADVPYTSPLAPSAGRWTAAEAPSLLPVRWFGPWERNIAPFLRVFSYDRRDDVASWRVLWRLIRLDYGERVNYFELAPVFTAHSETDAQGAETFQWKVLRGLIGYRRTESGREAQLLYFLRIGGSDANAP